MQFTLIAVQKNGQQVVLAQDAQEHSMKNILRDAVESVYKRQVNPEARYRSFLALGTTEHTTQVLRINDRGDVVHNTAGLL